MKIGSYTLANADKVDRAINGTVVSQGRLTGGVGADAKPAAILAEYDRIGGLILKDGKYKVKTGSFYDIKGKKPHAKPKPKLVFTVNGETVEVDADKPLPLEVQAAQLADEKRAKKAAAKRKKAVDAKKKKAASKKSKAKAEDDEDEDEEEVEDEDTEDEEDEDTDEDEDEGELA